MQASIIVPDNDRERLTPLIRLMITQIVRRLTEKLAYNGGRPVSPHRRPLLLMLDEFDRLGHFEKLAEAMNHMAGYGLRACLVVQSLNQILATYGANQSITINCDTTVRLTPNTIESAEEISRLVGQTSVRHDHRTRSGSGESVSQPEVGRPLMTPDEARRMSVDDVLIFARGRSAIRATLFKYHEHEYFRRLGAIPPPAQSDRIAVRKSGTIPSGTCLDHDPSQPPAKSSSEEPSTINKREPLGRPSSFLKAALAENAAKVDDKTPEDGKERLV
jgi:type IV secretion system protein VirD4